MPAKHNWQLCDPGGLQLGELTTASGRSYSLLRNRYVEVQFTLSHKDDAALALLDVLKNTGIPTLKVYRRGPYDLGPLAPLRFRGYLAGLQESSDETSMLTATFRSPFGALIGDGDKTGRPLKPGNQLIYVATDAGYIAKALIDMANADGATGLATNTTRIGYTTTRDRTYTVGTNIGQAIINLTNVIDGFDFYESFLDGIGSTLAMFNVVPSLGSVNTTAKFEYGEDTLANTSGMTRNTLPPANNVLVTGGNGLTSLYVDQPSVDKYGKWYLREDFPDVIEQATLDAKAQALARPNPITTVAFTPELGLDNCPKPFDDWNIGDTVPYFARRDALLEDTQLRLNGFVLPIDENGYEAVEVDDPTSPADDATIKASMTAEVI